MSTLITSITPELGATPDGKSWCLKALHPSDASVEVRGIPDRSAVPTVMVNYQTTARLTAPEGSADGWSFDAQITPHPVSFGFWASRDNASAHTGAGAFLNEQLTGADHAAKLASFLATCERWRLAYMGVSVHYDGAALANQGSIVCNQAAYEARKFYLSNPGSAGTYLQACPAMCVPDGTDGTHGSDFPDYGKSASMPNSYVGQVKDGLYVPLKLTKTCQQWQGQGGLEMWGTTAQGVYGDILCTLPKAPYNCAYPFYGLPGASTSAAGLLALGTATSPMCNGVVANICARNMSTTAGLIFTFRVGFEVQVEPGTLLTPYQRVSPMYDGPALKAYAIVARELKDAYPVEYNDLGKLWDTISSAVRTVQPVLTAINPALGAVAGGGLALGDSLRKLYRNPDIDPSIKVVDKRGASEKSSAAARERAQEKVKTLLAAPPRARRASRRGARTAPRADK